MAKKLAKTQRNTKRGVIVQSKVQNDGQPAKGWLINKQKFGDTLK